MPIEIFDVTNYCGCSACQADLTQEQREQYQTHVREEQERSDREAQEAAQRRRDAREAERVRLAQPFTCPECEDEYTIGQSTEVGDQTVCTVRCATTCTSCRNQVLTDETTTIERRWRDNEVLCEECTRECYSCEQTIPRDETYSFNGEDYCGDCTSCCDYCDERYVGECENDRCMNRIRGLSGYGKTIAQRWLGGPVRNREIALDKGYYLGFELEISANTGEVQPVYDWAQQNLGYSDALDCKEDSSVEGFEIATQPMTPAFFESVNWESLFEMLNERFPLDSHLRGKEPVEHGLHVHIGRVAFDKDDIAMAAFCYLIGQGDHLVRVGRREPTTYCSKVTKPVSSVIKAENGRMGTHSRQARKPSMRDVYLGRDAINLSNGSTIEIRAFRSTRKADDLRDAMRLVYVAAEYIRSLRAAKGSVSPKALHWATFASWVGVHHPDAFASIAGITDKKVVR